MSASSLRTHMERTHGNIMTHTCGVDIVGGVVETYVVSFPYVM